MKEEQINFTTFGIVFTLSTLAHAFHYPVFMVYCCVVVERASSEDCRLSF